MRQFTAAGHWLDQLDARTMAGLLAAAGDVTLVLDGRGVIVDLAFGNDELAAVLGRGWIGRPWLETVTVESRPKITALLEGAAAGAPARWRQINHPAPGSDIPLLCLALPMAGQGLVIVLGRDLRPTAGLQQQLVDVQQAMERDYSRLRHAETRYRLLFQTTAEAMLIVDAAAERVVEANPAAAELLGVVDRKLAGRPFPDRLDEEGMAAVGRLFARLRATGRPGQATARLAADGRELIVAVSLFRQGNEELFAIRLVPVAAPNAAGALQTDQRRLLKLLETAPDAFVVADANGRVIAANAAFLELAQLTREEQVRGESLERWLGRPGVDLGVVIAALRQHGTLRLYATTLRGEFGAVAEIELSAAMLAEGGEPCLGFTIRDVGRRPVSDVRARHELPRSVDQLTELVGRVPLKEVVRETTDVIERLCIEAALEITGDNRASAAEILGLSRQSLYVKLRRYGLGDLSGEDS